MYTSTIKIEHSNEEAFALTRAVFDEGYIGYWGESQWHGHGQYPHITVVEQDEPTTVHRLGTSEVLHALARIANKEVQVSPSIAADALKALQGEVGDLDADVADVATQVACFGEIVYG